MENHMKNEMEDIHRFREEMPLLWVAVHVANKCMDTRTCPNSMTNHKIGKALN